MIYSQFTLGKTYIKFYDVKGIPLILSLLTVLTIFLFIFIISLPATGISQNLNQQFTLGSHLIVFATLLVIFFIFSCVIYYPLCWLVWRFAQNSIEAEGYNLHRSYENKGKKKVGIKILFDFPNIENLDVVLVLYRRTYYLYKK